MKELFEIELKGNTGNTIKTIKTISKNTTHQLYSMPEFTIDEYEIVLIYHNGEEETLKFTNTKER